MHKEAEGVGVTVESQGERSLLRAQRNRVGTWVRATVAKDTCLSKGEQESGRVGMGKAGLNT